MSSEVPFLIFLEGEPSYSSIFLKKLIQKILKDVIVSEFDLLSCKSLDCYSNNLLVAKFNLIKKGLHRVFLKHRLKKL